MSRRRGAFSAFEKTASQAAAATQSNQSDASRERSSLQVGAARLRRGPPKSLALHEVKTLLESLRSASTHTDFQKALVNLRGRGWGALKKREAVARLLGMAWKAPLKAAGFSIDQWGFPEMLAAVRAHQAQPGIKTLSEEIERQLRFQPGDLFGSKAGAMKQTSSAAEAAAVTEAEVQAGHGHAWGWTCMDLSFAIGGQRCTGQRLELAADTDVAQPKLGVKARKLGRPEIARNGDGLFAPSRLGMKRQVFIMGTSLAAMPASGSFASQPAAKPQAPQAPQAPEPVPTRDRPLNLGEAKELLKAFREIASTKDFQKTLGNIHKQGSDAVQRMQPMFVGQSFNRTMAMYDFPLTTEGYQDMARGISKHSWNIHVKAQAHEVERLLRMPPGAFFGIPGEPGQAIEVPPRQEFDLPEMSRSTALILPTYKVLARHAVDNAEVRVALAHDATFFDCKQAISKFLGRDEILRKGRLVQKKGGVYSTYKDDDPIGDIRQVLVLGADLRTVEDQEDDQPPPIHPYAGPEIGLTIWTNWTFAAVREALAKKLGRDDIRRKARFVFKASAGTSPWIAFKERQCPECTHLASSRHLAIPSVVTVPETQDQETVGWAPDGSRRAELMMLGAALSSGSADGDELIVSDDDGAADGGGIALQLGITQLMGQAVQKAAESVLGRAWKLQKVIDAVKAHSNDQSVRTLADGVERRLRLDPGMLFSRPQDSRDTMKASLGRSAVEDELEHMESEPAGLPELSVHQVIAMQRELHAGFSDPAFQRRLDILENFHAKDPKLIPMRQELFLSVQSKVLPKYGFQGSLKGVFDMLEVFRRPDLQHNGEFVRLGSELNALLRLMPDGRPRPVKREAFPEPAGARAEPSHVTGKSAKPKTPTPPVERQPAPVRDIEVIIRHAVPEGLLANEEALLTVKSNATMKSVKEALVAHLGKPELLRSCRLVQPVGENGAFSSFKDTEKLNGRRALLGKAVAPEPPKLSIHQALALQRDLLQGFSDPDFQQKRKELVAALRHTEPRKFSVERQKLFLTVQRVVLPRYGFDGSPKGVFDMLQQFDRPEITANGEFQQQGAVLNHLLFAEDPAEAIRPPVQAFPEPEVSGRSKKTRAPPARQAMPVHDIEVVVRHAVQDDFPNEEALLTVKSNATMKSVKEALVAHLGKPELLRSCRLVQPVGENGAFSSFKDTEKLNGRRALLVLGVPSLRPAGEEAPEEAPAEKASYEPRKPEGKAVAPEPPKLSIHQALALQRDLLQGFSDPDFQQKRKELVAALRHTEPRKFSVERQKLFLTVQRVVLPRYGFDGSPKGVFDMLQQFDRPEITANGEFQQQGAVLNHLLFAEDPAEAIRPPVQAFPEPEVSGRSKKTRAPPARQAMPVHDIEVVVRHAVQDDFPNEEALLTVKSNATMKSVKEALVAHLGKPELLRSCRLVQPVGENGAFSSFKDTEKLNGRRALLVLGVPSLRPAGEEAPEEAPAEKASYEPRKPEGKAVAPEPPKLSIHQALALQRDLLQGFSDPDFQQKRKELVAALRHTEPRKFSVERQKLFLTVQRVVLPRYGFDGSPKGVFDMLQQFDRPEITANGEFQQQGAVLNDLLFGDAGAPAALQASERQSKPKARGPPPARPAAPVRDVEVLVRHAVQEDHPNEEALLTVKSNATMKSVKEALVAHLGKPELLRSCRLVQPVGENGAFSSFKDTEKLNGRRALLVLGVPSLRPAGEEVPEEAPAEKASYEPRKPEGKAVAPEPPKLSIDQALALQRDLLQGFSDPDFQQKRKELVAALRHTEPRKFSMERQKLFLTVQKVVLPRYGFDGSPKGVFDMLQQFDRPEITSNGEFQQQGAILNHLLFAEEMADPANAVVPPTAASERQPKPKARGPPPARPAAPVRDVEVLVRHAVQEDHPNEEALLTVKSNATMKSVKEALVAHLGKPELLRSCRLVQPVGENGAFSSFKDTEKLNGRRALLVLGEAPEEAPAEKAPCIALRGVTGKAVAPEPPKLSIHQALALQHLGKDTHGHQRPAKTIKQRDLLQGFSDPDFQQKRKELVAALRHTEPRKFSVERQKLFLTVQRVVLPRYGFDGSPKGVFDMLQQFDRPEITSNGEFQQQGAVLNELLFAEDVAPGTEDVSQVSEPPEVQVRVRRAGDTITSEEVYVTVAGNATMRDVRAAVAQKCSNPAFLQRAKLVRNRGGVLVGYQDSEPIRGRRRLLFLGPSLWPDGEVGDEAPSAVEDSDSEAMVGPGGISLEKARRLLQKVKDACGSRGFQQSVAELRVRARQRGETAGTRMAVGTLFIAACQSILRKFGFGVDRQGYEQMFTAIFPHGQDPTVLALASDIEKDLGVPTGSWFGLSNDGIQDAAPRLSREEARQLVTEIRRLVGSPTFQKEVLAIRDGVRSRNGSLEELKQEVYLPFYRLVRPVALAFRLGGDPECVTRVSAALAPHLVDAKLRSAVRQVETSFLHTHQGAFFALTPQEAELQGSGEASVKIRIRHAVSGAEVPLTVAASSTIGQVKEAAQNLVDQILPPGQDKFASAQMLAYELQQEKMAQKAMQEWQDQLNARLLQLREKTALNEAMNSLVLHLKKEGLTEGELFAKIDADSDGELSRQELQGALRKLGVDLTTTELDGILRIFDADGSGTIDFAEFYHLLKSQEALLPSDFVPSDAGKKKDPLYNFEAGDRVRLHLCMSNRALHANEHDEHKNLHGKIVGPGTRKGTLLMQLEESDCTLLVKPRQVSKTRSHALSRAKTSVFQ
ncbi:CPK19 [Symbiodinium natans]|uniref:CPK19 protein n=1 Tax=Symbiodinium natans TaxID=878477 RepID=A0A812TGD7_9DINO|nr:CPK19 [Symbiodinium natans]